MKNKEWIRKNEWKSFTTFKALFDFSNFWIVVRKVEG